MARTSSIQAVEGHFDLLSRDWRASGPEMPLLVGDLDDFPDGISPDGQVLAFTRTGLPTGRDIFTMRLDDPAEPEPFRVTDAAERDAEFSPDGRWIVYASDESGRYEIWLESYLDSTRGRHPITTEGGQGPHWGPDGELFITMQAR